MGYRNPLCYRYGLIPLRRSYEQAYVLTDGTKEIWSEASTSRGRLWTAFGADHMGSASWTARTFPTLREAVSYARGVTIEPLPRKGR